MDGRPATFVLTVEFPPGSPDPARIFRAVEQLLRAFDEIDRDLAGVLHPAIEAAIVLEDIEAGSLRVLLRQIVGEIPDDAVRRLDVRELVGHFLVKGKHLLMNRLSTPGGITDRAQLQATSDELNRLAGETGVQPMLTYNPPTPAGIGRQLELLSRATAALGEGDSVRLESDDAEPVSVGPANQVTLLDLEPLLTRESIDASGQALLLVRRPDYLGNAMWQFRHGNRSIDARIEDVAWLRRFQGREIDVRPGDALRVRLESTTYYGFDNEVVRTTYAISRVIEVRPAEPARQHGFLPGQEDPRPAS